MTQRIGIFAALQWECRAVLRALRQVRRARLGAFTAWQASAPGREVWVVKTGVGVERASAAVEVVGAAQAFDLFVSSGCAGGLAPDLKPGDLVLATAVSGDGTTSAIPSAAVERARARQSAAAAGLCCVEGPLLCSAGALLTAAAKRAAAADGALVVEMEGGAIAAHAAATGVPWLSVRAILDAAEHELPVPATVIDAASGEVRPLALAGYVARHPGVLGELMSLQRLQRSARDSLERFFAQWLAERG